MQLKAAFRSHRMPLHRERQILAQTKTTQVNRSQTVLLSVSATTLFDYGSGLFLVENWMESY